MPDIADYDKSGYDYTKYWEGRQYELKVEKLTLTKLLPPRGDSILDIGGGYGRLMDVYCSRFLQCTILDYSTTLLNIAIKRANQQGVKNLQIIQGDAYHLPFSDNNFDCAMMIRVLHHLEKPQLAIAEISRVLKHNGIFILEMANKINLKALIREMLKGNLLFRQNEAPLKISTTTIQSQEGIFYNFHPKYIEKLLKENEFEVQQQLSVSNLRSPTLKEIIPSSILLKIDQLIEPLFTRFYLGPSIWFKCIKK